MQDSGYNNRKRHVGNDAVQVIFSDEPFVLEGVEGSVGGAVGTGVGVGGGAGVEKEALRISGQFGFVTIVVVPILHSGCMLVQVLLRKGAKGLSREELSCLQHLENRVIIPRGSAASYVRNLAIRADVACKCMKENVLGFDNWSERLLQIRRLRRLAVGVGGGGGA